MKSWANRVGRFVFPVLPLLAVLTAGGASRAASPYVPPVVQGTNECRPMPIDATPYICNDGPYKGRKIGRSVFFNTSSPYYELRIFKQRDMDVDLKSLSAMGLTPEQLATYFGPGREATVRVKYTRESGRAQIILSVAAQSLASSSGCSGPPQNVTFKVISSENLSGITDDAGLKQAAEVGNASWLRPLLIALCRGVTPPTIYNLNVSSSPANGVAINIDGQTAATPFSRKYDKEAKANVTLGAPPADKANNPFVAWQVGNKRYPAQSSVTVSMTGNVNAVAVYQGPVTLTVSSSNLEKDQIIKVAPADLKKQGDGSGRFTRQYKLGSKVTVIAPAANRQNHKFGFWQENGEDLTGEVQYTVTMDANRVLTAVYPKMIEKPCPPCPSNTCCGDGKGLQFCAKDPNAACPVGTGRTDCQTGQLIGEITPLPAAALPPPASDNPDLAGRGDRQVDLNRSTEIFLDESKSPEERASSFMEVLIAMLQDDRGQPWRDRPANRLMMWLLGPEQQPKKGSSLWFDFHDDRLHLNPRDAWVAKTKPGFIEQVTYLCGMENNGLRRYHGLAEVFDNLPAEAGKLTFFQDKYSLESQNLQQSALAMARLLLNSALYSSQPYISTVEKTTALMVSGKLLERTEVAGPMTAREKAADEIQNVDALKEVLPLSELRVLDGLKLWVTPRSLRGLLADILNDQDRAPADGDVLEESLLGYLDQRTDKDRRWVEIKRLALRAAAAFDLGQLREVEKRGEIYTKTSAARQQLINAGTRLREDTAPPEWAVDLMLARSHNHLNDIDPGSQTTGYDEIFNLRAYENRYTAFLNQIYP